jgi:hypothetical protein
MLSGGPRNSCERRKSGRAGVPVGIARGIAEAVARDVGESITSEELRYRVLEMIRDRNREWEANWFLFERAVKRRNTC